MSLSVKTLLRHVQDFGPCTISETRLTKDYRPKLEVVLKANRRHRARCSCCGEPAPRYDQQPQRRWQYIALWNFMVHFLYSPWRVDCARCGVKIEALPWSTGKSPYSKALMHFLARWARRLSWKETAAIFRVSWDGVYRSVQWLVEWGLAHRDLSGVSALGIDELHWGKGKRSANFVTVIYQIDAGCRRLLWVGQRRAEATLRGGLRALEALHAGFCAGITVVCSDMWKPYLKVVRTLLSAALNILDPFHIARHLHGALDEVRRGEQSRMNAAARARIKGARFALLKRRSRVRGKARERLHDALIALKETSQAWVFKEAFRRFWRFRCPRWAGAWLRGWVQTVKESGIKPMVRVATMLDNHHDLLLNCFRAKRQYTNAVTEGLNHKDGVTNLAEFNLSALGFDPLVDNTALRTLLHSNAAGMGLYRAADMQALALGAPLLERNAVTGNFVLRLGIEQSPDLTNWTALPGTVDFPIAPAGPAPLFFRVLGRKP